MQDIQLKRTDLRYIAKRTAMNTTIDYDDIADIEEIASVLIIGLVVYADWLIDSRQSRHSRGWRRLRSSRDATAFVVCFSRGLFVEFRYIG